ncbi:helix-turn-helix domain-containing protein [Thalassotalea atypica]|uniref:helix-turn-helix domain-containing protein n=1 Tax=Thalassotalea atypica TaxID=2054316 RepID=UPI002573EA4B|nr:helix-turn-helix domain-containing protein [Thalassotalea atypica]
MTSSLRSLALTEKVNEIFARSELPASITIEDCVATLAMSTTSFRRKLSQEETSFKLIQQKFLNELCVEALLTQEYHIDELAAKLGYSERATFERAFRHKFGITASQFRELSSLNDTQQCKHTLIKIAQHLPPMSDSCKQLIKEKEQGHLDTVMITNIINRDPVLSGRIIGLASKAIYGRTPKDLQDAIGRNLGVTTVLNVAMLFSMKDALQDHVSPIIINSYSDAFMLAPKLFQLLRKSCSKTIKWDISLTEQVLIFGLLGIFLLTHKQMLKRDLVMHSLQGIDCLRSLNQHIKACTGKSIYSASALMLSLWHLDASVIKQLAHIDRVSLGLTKGSEQDRIVLFMMSCLYRAAANHDEDDEMAQQAQLLNITCIDDINSLLHA